MSRDGSGGYSPPQNSWNPAINGMAALPNDWMAILNDMAAAIQASIAADGQTPITGSLNFGNNRLRNVGAPQGQGDGLRLEQIMKGADIPSATTIAFPIEGSLFDVTGTTNITGIVGAFPGRGVLVRFMDTLTLTHGTNLQLPGGTNITTQAGDFAAFVCLDGTKWQCWLYPRRLAAYPTLVKEYDSVALMKTGASAISIRAGTHVRIDDSYYVEFSVDTAVTMPALTAGADYSVWVAPDGTAQAVLDMYSAPATAPTPGAVKFGGFHYGLVAPGTTVASGGFSTGPVTGSGGSFAWTQADVDRIAGINEFSIWDLGWRCAGEQHGMTYSPLSQSWIAIYFCNTAPHINGISRYNTDVASGTVLPVVPLEWGGDGTLKYTSLRSWEAQELVSAHGLRLIRSIEEFIPAAFGVTEGQSLGGGSVTIPATARQPGYTSRIGIEQATGHAWVIGAPVNAVGGSAYAGNGRGSWWGSYGLPLLGGSRDVAAVSGSRCAAFFNALSASNWASSVRAAGDHLNLGRTAR